MQGPPHEHGEFDGVQGEAGPPDADGTEDPFHRGPPGKGIILYPGTDPLGDVHWISVAGVQEKNGERSIGMADEIGLTDFSSNIVRRDFQNGHALLARGSIEGHIEKCKALLVPDRPLALPLH
jgi:hypothetical protein